jgi:hypothetical protein
MIGAALIAPAATMASTPASTSNHVTCGQGLFSWDVASGSNAYPMLTVHITPKGSIPDGCTVSFSLNAYDAQGATWPTSGTQALAGHDSVTLSAANPSGTLTVPEPACFGQTDFYLGTTRYDGVDGALPHYPGVVTPYDLIAYSNGGAACQQPTEQPTLTPTEQPTLTPTEQPTLTPTEDPTLTPTDQPTLTPTDQPTLTPTQQPENTPTVAPTATPRPTGTVEGNTGAPEITPPPTDTLGTATTGTGSGLPLILAAVAAFALALLFVTPSRKRSRR